MMKTRVMLWITLLAGLLLFTVQAKKLDPYKVLGVERNANQREIQKAFHKLSLQYHPDKNKNKGAQEKFAEINNAYDILSDEEKRKNYDLYGDEKGSPGFDTGNPGDHGGYTYFTSGGPGHSGFTSKPGDWQSTGGQGGSKSFSFSFGGSGSQSSFGWGLDDIFSSFFGGDTRGGNRFGGFGTSTSQFGSQSSPKNIRSLSLHVYRKEIVDKGMTWILLSYTPTLKGIQHYESIIEEAASSLQGTLEVGSINCDTESSLCNELGIYPRGAARIFVYSYKVSESGSLVEYNGDLAARSAKTFFQDHLPRFSKRVDLTQFVSSPGSAEILPKVLLLSSKKDTPVIWRALSGLYHKRFIFYDAEVHDISNPAVQSLSVDSLPSIVGWLSNGEQHVLKKGISVKDIKSAIRELSALLDGFEKKNKKAYSTQGKWTQSESAKKQIPLLSGSNFDAVCGEKTPVCIIGGFRSSRARDKIETFLLSVSQKSLSRRPNAGFSSRDPVSYALLDASKQSSFLESFDKSGFKSLDQLLVAYKPQKGKFAAFKGEMNVEEVERFVSSVLNGDVRFTKTRQKPILK